jgi:uncharacterized protein (TIGR02246 family)
VEARLRRVSLLLLSILAALGSRPIWAQSDDDRAEIRRLAMRQGETWGRDARGYAALCTEDCDVVNIVGWRWKGRAEVERKLTQAFQVMFRESKLTISEVDTRFLRPDVAITHVRWTMVGAKAPPGMPEPREGIQTLVFTKQSGRWLISAFQNTLSRPELPFPAPSGGAGGKSR